MASLCDWPGIIVPSGILCHGTLSCRTTIMFSVFFSRDASGSLAVSSLSVSTPITGDGSWLFIFFMALMDGPCIHSPSGIMWMGFFVDRPGIIVPSGILCHGTVSSPSTTIALSCFRRPSSTPSTGSATANCFFICAIASLWDAPFIHFPFGIMCMGCFIVPGIMLPSGVICHGTASSCTKMVFLFPFSMDARMALAVCDLLVVSTSTTGDGISFTCLFIFFMALMDKPCIQSPSGIMCMGFFMDTPGIMVPSGILCHGTVSSPSTTVSCVVAPVSTFTVGDATYNRFFICATASL